MINNNKKYSTGRTPHQNFYLLIAWPRPIICFKLYIRTGAIGATRQATISLQMLYLFANLIVKRTGAVGATRQAS